MADSSYRKHWIQLASLSMFLVVSGIGFVYFSGRYKDVPGCRVFYERRVCEERSHSLTVQRTIYAFWRSLYPSSVRVVGCGGKVITSRYRLLKPLNGMFKCK